MRTKPIFPSKKSKQLAPLPELTHSPVVALGQNRLHQISVHVRQAVVPTLEFVSQLGVVDAEKMENGGVQVVDGDRILHDFVAEIIRPSVGEAFPDAVRSGPWKLFTRDYTRGGQSIRSGTLYNLEEDIGETTDVAAIHPEIVSKLQALAETSREDLGDGPERPGRNIRKAAYIPLAQATTLTPCPHPWSEVQRNAKP